MEYCPYLSSIVYFFALNATVNLVRLLRLAPGAVVQEHTNPTLGLHIEKSLIRLTIQIMANDQVEFYLNNTLVPMKVGEGWYLNLTNPHRVLYNRIKERINLTIDVVPNQCIVNLIRDAELT